MAKGDSGLAAPVWKARRSSLNSGAPWPTPDEAAEWVLGIQRKLHRWACDDQSRRFSDLHNLVCDRATLLVAWGRVRGNRGSRSVGVDGQTAAHVERVLGVEWIVEADIEACFDSLDHTALTGRVRARVGDRRVLRLVKAFLKAGIMNERGDLEETRTGTPQGGILTAPTQ